MPWAYCLPLSRPQQSEHDAGVNAPGAMSPSVSLVGSLPGSVGISGCFMKTAPLFVNSGLDSVVVHDVSNPRDPKRVGALPSLQFENEAMNRGERKVGKTTQRFALIGVDLHQASPDDISHVNEPATGDYELVIVDVTDPTTPEGWPQCLSSYAGAVSCTTTEAAADAARLLPL